MKQLYVLKIGGSVATYKDNIKHTVRKDVLQSIFNEITLAKKESSFDLIIVHGAGGHVHHLAQGLKEGTQNDPTKTTEALATQAAVTNLHNEIMKIGTEAGLKLESIPTHNVVTQRDGKIESFDTQNITTLITEDSIPVLYGDMVNDQTIGMSICSGDVVTAHLVTLLPVTHLFFATDVNGIYTADPHTDSNATLVQNLNFGEMEETIKLTESHNADTTGGLKGKMEECTKLFTTSPLLEEIHVFNGLESGNYQHVLAGINFPHTRIQK